MRSARIELILDTLKAIKGAKDLSKSVETVSDRLGDTARQGEAAAKAVDDAGDQMSDAARAAAKLDREIEQLTGSLRELAIAQALTGESSAKQIREQESQLRRLTRNRKLFGQMGEDAAPEFATSFSSKLGPLLAKMPVSAHLVAGLAGVGAALAPMLGGVIAGAVIGGAGIGGVVGGFALAQRDERVAAQIAGLGDRLEQRLVRAAGGFVGPALSGLADVEKALNTVDLDRMLRDSAKFVPVLTDGVTSAIVSLGDGLEELIGKAGPVVDAFSRSTASVGATIGDSFKLLATDADAGASSIDDFTLALNNFITTSVGVIHGLAQIKGAMDGLDGGIDGVRHSIEDFFTEMSGGRAEFDITADGMTNVERKAKEAADAQAKMNEESIKLAGGIRQAAEAADLLKARQQELSAAQAGAKTAQDALTQSLESMLPKAGRAAELTNNLRTASQNLFGAQIAGVEANEAYQASWDSLSESVKKNKGSLDSHTAAGRANRDSLEALLGASNEMYFANVAQGQSTDEARKKHEKRTEAVRKESVRLGLNKTQTEKLIATYGKIPGDKTTNLVVSGLAAIKEALENVYIAQRALAEGKTIQQVKDSDANKAWASMKGWHSGGYTGDMDPRRVAGVVHGREMVINADSTAKIERQNPGVLREMNATGQIPGYAAGGLVAPVETRRRIPMNVDVSKSFVLSMEAALAKVTPAFGNWPSSPSAQRGDSGVWKRVVQLIRSGPHSGSFGNAYRPGDPKWHGSGRAVDWMGYNQDPLASFLAAKRPLELIHRTNSRDYAYTRGVNKGSFNNSLMEAHRNHIHIAMQNGGIIPEPVYGVGQSGRTYSFAENGRPERVLSAGQTARGGGAVTIAPVININGSNLSAKQIADAVGRELGKQADAYARSVA